ncbi:MAG: DUF2303 family protein [Pseudomonadota bacterium]
MKEAVEYLIQTGAAQCTEHALPKQLALVPSSHDIQSVEYAMPNRVRYRTGLKTSSLTDFIEMSEEDISGLPGQACLIDADKMSAKTYFNLGDAVKPGHGDHWAQLTLERTSEFSELLKVDGQANTQKAAAEWLEDWREYLTPVWDGQLDSRHTMQGAITTVRNVKIEATASVDHSVGDFSASKTGIEQIEARGRDLPLPSHFLFKCFPYDGLSERDIAVRLSFTTGDKPKFTFRIVRKTHLESQLADEFKAAVRDLLVGFEGRVYIGTLSL